MRLKERIAALSLTDAVAVSIAAVVVSVRAVPTMFALLKVAVVAADPEEAQAVWVTTVDGTAAEHGQLTTVLS